MKKTIFLLAAGCAAAVFFPGHASAQDTRNQTALAGTETTNAHSLVAPSNGSFAHEAEASTVSGHALIDFKGRFSDGKDVKWYALTPGFEVCFKQDGYIDRAFYSKKGQWQRALRFCDEDQLPRDIRAVVKQTYYDFSITVAEIVEIPGQKVYLVHLEDKNSLIIVRVSEEGEMSVWKEFSKAN
jgi:hypothetical protein